QEEFIRLMHPRAVVPTRLGDTVVDASVVSACFAFFAAYIAIFLTGFVLLTFFGEDMLTAFSGAAATLGNVGPGFEMVGQSSGFALQSTGVKLVHMALMLCGRLEIFTLLAILTPRFWRR
ncbi:MAG: TrkH family potassium uptake protein, partial [Synergistaceae bacterium]|nr:TrkH family potassium uptake protein [Synergistaceae bacterium]